MKKILGLILRPVTANITIFVVSILLMGAFEVIFHQYLLDRIKIDELVMELQEMVFMAYIFCLLSYLLRKICFKVLIYAFLFCTFILGTYLIYVFRTDIAPNILLLLFETNQKEIAGFFQTYFLNSGTMKTIIMVLILALMTFFGEHYHKQLTRIVSKPAGLCIISLILLFGALGSVGTIQRYWQLANCQRAVDAELWKRDNLYFEMHVPNLLYSFTAIILADKDLDAMISATKESLKWVEPVKGDSLNIVLVIGESYSKYHCELYGYELHDTPFMCAERDNGNLFAFNNVMAPHNMTSIAIKNILCSNNVHEGERWHDHPFFPAIFKKAGYDVWIWDNQYQDKENMPWSFTLNSIMFNNEIMRMSYSKRNDKCLTYDEELIDDFKKKQLADIGRHNLVIFHLIGQHFPANMQYPNTKENNVFTKDDIKGTPDYVDENEKQEIADYANATRYNDGIIKQITELFQNTNTILVYFPDHGDEVYDYRDYQGRSVFEKMDNISPEMLKYQLGIPLVVWCSDKWKEKHAEEWETIGKAVDRAFTTDNACHMLFRLAGIKTKEYNSSRDLFSPDFVPQTKPYDVTNI